LTSGKNRTFLGIARICRPEAGRTQVTLDSPAIEVMTDLKHVPAVVIDPQATMELAHGYMMQRGVRMLLALNKDDTLAGIVTSSDVLGEKPVALVRERRIHHSDILVADIMTPALRLDKSFSLPRSMVDLVASRLSAFMSATSAASFSYS
jgi:signal-transduction protein with cAMP-binding, CBS, and nucleotidyltransferase domain